MGSSSLPVDTRFDRMLEEISEPGFDYSSHLDTISATYVFKRARYEEFVRLLRATDADQCRKMQSQINGGGNVISMSPEMLVHSVYPEAPVHAGATIPTGWALRDFSIGDHAIIKLGSGETGARGVLPHPLFVSAVLSDIATGDVMLEIAWQFRPGGRWKTTKIEKGALGSKAKIATELARCGTAVNANNAAGVIEWLTCYQAANVGKTKSGKTTKQLGWVGNEFVLPGECIGGKREISFVPAGDGNVQAGEAIRQSGTIEGWVKAINEVADYNLVITGLYASLSPVLLEPLLPNETNPIIDWSYRTSTGKTTTLQLAASVWGEQRALLTTWSGTQQGLIGRAIALNHLPTIIDDSKTAREYGGKSTVPQLIYTLSSGIDAARNSPNGLQRTKRFRTTVLSTGEDKAIDADKSGGTVARVLSVWGSPFGEESSQTKTRIATAKAGIEEHHGLAGPLFVSHVTENRDRWPEWRARLGEITVDIQAKLGGDHRIAPGMLDRSAKVVALLQTTAEISHECICFPWATPDLVSVLTPSMVGETSSSNRELEAMVWLIGRIGASPGRIVEDENEYGKMMGSVSLLGVRDGGPHYVALFWPSLQAELRSGGHNSQSITRSWRERGWLRDGTVSWLSDIGSMAIITTEAAEAAGVST